MESMTEISAHFKQWVQHTFTILLHCCYHGPIVEQSRRNCTGSRFQHTVASEERMGNLFRNDQQSSIMSALVAARDGQDSRRDSTVPLWLASEPQHDGKEHNPVLLHGTQCPDRASILNLPDKSLA